MKRIIAMLMLIITAFVFTGCADGSAAASGSEAVQKVSEAANAVVKSLPQEIRDKIDSCEAVFVGVEKQPYTDETGSQTMLNTVWLYYGDNTFEQYALVDGAMQVFSTGTYELLGDSDFAFADSKDDMVEIVLHRNQKYQAGKGLAEYDSTHTYELNTLGFELYKK